MEYPTHYMCYKGIFGKKKEETLPYTTLKNIF